MSNGLETKSYEEMRNEFNFEKIGEYLKICHIQKIVKNCSHLFHTARYGIFLLCYSKAVSSQFLKNHNVKKQSTMEPVKHRGGSHFFIGCIQAKAK